VNTNRLGLAFTFNETIDMLTADYTRSRGDIDQILALQARNLKQNLSVEEKSAEGFLTMQFTPAMLWALHQLAPSVVVRDGSEIIAYAIVVLPEGRSLYPDLEGMFISLEKVEWNKQPLAGVSFYVMGQICVAKEYRGQGLFSMLYNKHRELFQDKYDCLVTEISTANLRSMRAHEKVGFQAIHRYRDYLDEWNVVLWDWNSNTTVKFG
jgi:ribosomal protein S18 acetylase RimI-like enzyme